MNHLTSTNGVWEWRWYAGGHLFTNIWSGTLMGAFSSGVYLRWRWLHHGGAFRAYPRHRSKRDSTNVAYKKLYCFLRWGQRKIPECDRQNDALFAEDDGNSPPPGLQVTNTCLAILYDHSYVREQSWKLISENRTRSVGLQRVWRNRMNVRKKEELI